MRRVDSLYEIVNIYVLIIQDIQQTRTTEYKTMDPVWEEAIHSYMAVTHVYEPSTMVT